MIKDFLKNFKSVVISTIDENSLPFTSYAPFIKKDYKYYVYLSSMARHTKNLNSFAKNSLFFIEDEKTCENIFARKRVVFQCSVNKINRDTKEHNELIEIFEDTHGEIMSILKNMKDFSIFEFTPKNGEAIFGFGKAYDVGGKNCEELIERKNLKGHSK